MPRSLTPWHHPIVGISHLRDVQKTLGFTGGRDKYQQEAMVTPTEIRGWWVTIIMVLVLVFEGTQGNWIKRQAQRMFEHHGEDATLVYAHPQSVGRMSFLPALIEEPTVILSGLSRSATESPTLFSQVPDGLDSIGLRRMRYITTTAGLCFCCGNKGTWNRKWRDYEKHEQFLKNLQNYTYCTDRFYLHGTYNESYMPEDLNQTEWNEMYPEYPMFYNKLAAVMLGLGQGSICSGWQARDPNIWFFFDKWATNFHPGNYQCVGVGYLTFPVQVYKSQEVRQKRDIYDGALGSDCSDTVIIDHQLSDGSSVERAVKGAITGILTLGSYPGIIAQENRKSILGLTCRLEKSINATGEIVRMLQSEIEELSQMIMQQRLALDYLLAAKGGFCKMIGSQCVVKFHNLNRSIEDEMEKLKEMIQHNVKGIEGNWSLFGWLSDLWPSAVWIKEIITVIAMVVVMICVITCCFPILIRICQRSIVSVIPKKKEEEFAL